MNNTNTPAVRRRMLCILAALAASVVTQAQTTTEASTDEKSKGEVLKLSPFVISNDDTNGYRSENTVIGSRTAKNLLDISSTIAIINQEVITDLNAVDVHQLLQVGVAGVTQNQTINDDFNIRGFRAMFSMRDGITKVAYKRNPLYDVDRVEVIKGPAAMLIGNNSFLGGTVNFVTRAPSHVEGGDVQLTVGENNYYRLAANTTGPLVDKSNFKVDYRLTVGGLTADKDKEIEEEDQKFIGGALGMYFGSKTSFTLSGYYYKDDGYFYWEDFLDINSTHGTTKNPGWAVLNPYSTKDFSPGRSQDAFWNNQDVFINATFLTQLTDNANLRFAYYFSKDIDRRRHVRGIAISADNVTLQRQDIPVNIDAYTHDIQADFSHHLELPASMKLDSVVGADVILSYTKQDQAINTPPNLNTASPDWTLDEAYFSMPQPGAGLPFTSATSTSQVNRPESISYYFQENLSFWKDRVSLIGGLRWFVPDGYNQNLRTNVTTNRPSDSFKTHKYGVIVHPVPSISLYYTDAQTIIPQSGFVDLHTAGDNLDPLQNQEGKMKEAGLKADHKFSSRFSIYGSFAWYDMSLTHVRVVGSPLPDGTYGTTQSAADSATGYEYELGGSYKIGEGEFSMIATYADGTSSIAADPTIQAQDFVPRKYSFMGRYAWTGGALKGLAVGATYFDQTRKREGVYFIDFPATYNLFARYAWKKHWNVQLNLNNITDERYIVAIAATGLVQTDPGFSSRLALKYIW